MSRGVATQMPTDRRSFERSRNRFVAWVRGRRSPAVLGVAAVWFVLTLAAVLWSEGLGPHVFLSPDEMANRQAAGIISATGRPFLELPFADPENLAHPRPWITRGNVALPIYPPVTLYFYAFLTWLGGFGELLLVLLPASGAAAFAAGMARLLPPGRRWLALFAPALGVSSLYWLFRPWMNICALLTCLCWASNFWSLWRVEKRAGYLSAALLCVGAGVAARPDVAAYVLLAALILGVGAEPKAWRRTFVLVCVAGAFAVVPNLVGNYLVTGQPFRAAYQLVIDGEHPGPTMNPVYKLLELLFFPLTFPGWAFVGHELVRYWIFLQPMWLLLAAQVSLVFVLARRPRSERIAAGLVLVLALVFMISRIEAELFGVGRKEPWIHDSVPRYFSPVFLLASVSPLLALGEAKKRWTFIFGSVALAALAAVSVAQVVWSSQQSVLRHHELAAAEEGWLEKLARLIPRDAMVYTPTRDKVIGDRYLVGSLQEDDPDLGAASMQRAVASSRPVYYWTHRDTPKSMRPLERALGRRNLRLVRIDRGLRLYRVELNAPGAENP